MNTSESDLCPDVAISCAFQENAIQALAQEYLRIGRLSVRLVRDMSMSIRIAHLAARYAPARSRISKYLDRARQRSAATALCIDQPVAPWADLLRIVGGRNRNALSHQVGNSSWKICFSKHAARVPIGDIRILYGMPGSCLEVFRGNPRAYRVFHAIDAHPRARNEWLERCFTQRRAKGESYRESFVNRIEQELSLADTVLVPSRVVQRQMIEYGVPREKLLRIPYGVDISAFRPPENGRTDRHGQVRVICVAQISLRKGIPFLLDAVRGLDVELTIVGSIFDRRIIQGAPPNVKFRGAVPKTGLIHIYQEADAFVLPSIEDAFPLVIAEAAASGLPVITTTNVGSSEVLAAPPHAVVPVGDSAALRSVLSRLSKLSDEDRIRNAENVRNANIFQSWKTYSATVVDRIDRRVNGDLS